MILLPDVLRLAAGIIFLGYASYSDLKTRKVEDKVWLLLGGIGTAILVYEMLVLGCDVYYYLSLILILALFFSFFFEAGEKTSLKDLKINKKIWVLVWGIAISTFLYLIYAKLYISHDILFLNFLAIPLIMCFVYLLYVSRLLFGGADAKAVITIALLAPFYPQIFSEPVLGYFAVRYFWPYPIVILTNSIIVTLLLPIWYLVYNIAKKEIHFPSCLLGYKIDIDLAKRKYVWPMEQIKDGKKLSVYFPKRSENIKENLEKLRECGAKRIWVTPKIPFMLFLLIGFVLAYALGDILNKIISIIFNL